MPRRRSRNGSRAIRISCSIISVAACSAKNFATVSVAFLPAPHGEEGDLDHDQVRQQQAAQHELGRGGGRQPRAGLRRARRRHRNLLVGPGRDHHRGDSATNLSIPTDQNRYFDTEAVVDARRAGVADPDLRRASAWSGSGCSVRPCRLRCIGQRATNGGGGAGWQRRMVAVTSACPFDTPRPLGAPRLPVVSAERSRTQPDAAEPLALSADRSRPGHRPDTDHAPPAVRPTTPVGASGPGRVGSKKERLCPGTAPPRAGAHTTDPRCPPSRRQRGLVAPTGPYRSRRSSRPRCTPSRRSSWAARWPPRPSRPSPPALPAVDDGIAAARASFDRAVAAPRPRRRSRPSSPNRPSPTPPRWSRRPTCSRRRPRPGRSQ